MDIQIKVNVEFTLLGLSFFGDPFTSHAGWTEGNEIGRLWVRFLDYMKAADPEALPENELPRVTLECHIITPDSMETGEFEIFVGYKISDLDNVPADLLVKKFQPSTYVVFTSEGEGIMGNFDFDFDGELAKLGFKRTGPHFIQWYDERFKGLDNLEESQLDWWFPVTRIDAD